MFKQFNWYSPDQKIDSADMVHQVLAYGNLDDARAIIKQVGRANIKKLFLTEPKKIYTKSALNFLANFLLKITEPLDEDRYLKTTPRPLR